MRLHRAGAGAGRRPERKEHEPGLGGLLPRQRAGDRSIVYDADAIAHPEDLGKLRGISRIAMPSSAMRRMRSWISAFEPTSTPCVGSSSIITLGPIASQQASATFCWLPPDSDRAGREVDFVLI